MSSGTPRSKAAPAIPSPRASAKPAATGEKKVKKKKPSASAAPAAQLERATLGVPIEAMDSLSEDQAKSKLEELQKKYGILVVNFNNQQAELANCQKACAKLEEQNAELQARLSQDPSNRSSSETQLREDLTKAQDELRQSETHVMALQKKLNKMQVEHVSEEEVDQLFYALEQKEKQLEELTQEKEGLEAEVLTARQLSARGGGAPQIVEIHHHNDLSDDDDDAAPAPA